MNPGIENRIDEFDNEHLFINQEDGVLRVLLLEDLLSDAELIKLNLRKLQMDKRVEHVTNRADFEAALTRFVPHLILSDYSLPQFTGMEALELIKAHNPYIPFIICTGSVNEETAVACIKAGADDYVLKDSMGRLPSAIENAIAAKMNLVARHRADIELSKSEENFRALAQNAPDNIYKIARDGEILYVNCDIDGIPKEKVIGMKIYDFVNEENKRKMRRAIETSFDRALTVSVEIEGNPEDPESQWYFCRIGPVMENDRVKSLVFISSNITERVKAERELYELNEKLHHLTQHLETIRDEEKKKIAMEIHDQLGQELTGNKLGLFWIKQQLLADGLDPKRMAPIVEKVDYLVDLTTQTIQTVRRIAHELRPVVLDDIGLIPAIEWHVGNYNKNHENTTCHLHIEVGDLHFEKDFSTAIYRITQEALTNINRHAEAKNAWISILVENDSLLLKIEDDGKGIDIHSAMKSKSLGLFGMRERIKKWGGEFQMKGEKNKGTIITLTFSLPSLLEQHVVLKETTIKSE
ncbi:MAG: hypothetical protein RL226_859 [Bacteroidota bacterium]|jgi:two-component system sensor histidine kinase UhpB